MASYYLLSNKLSYLDPYEVGAKALLYPHLYMFLMMWILNVVRTECLALNLDFFDRENPFRVCDRTGLA